MDYNEIRKLVLLVEKAAITSLEVEEGGLSIRIEKQFPAQAVLPQAPVMYAAPAPMLAPAPAVAHVPGGAAPAPAAVSASNLLEVKAPMVGTFYRASGPDKEPFVKVGDAVSPGKTLCILEAMKIMNEIEAEISGRIVEILVENGQPVQFDQVLFRMEA